MTDVVLQGWAAAFKVGFLFNPAVSHWASLVAPFAEPCGHSLTVNLY